MQRRQFIHRGLEAAIVTALPFQKSWSMLELPTRYLETIGLQLYTVRTLLDDQAESTFESIRKLGYYQVELLDTSSLPELYPLATQAGLKVHSSFINWSAVTGGWQFREPQDQIKLHPKEIVEQAVKYDLSDLVFGYMMKAERQTLDDYKRVSEKINRFGELCDTADISLSYHNHSFEFEPKQGRSGMDILIEEFDPQLVHFEIDTFWVELGGADPIALIEQLGSRVKLLHLKDIKEGTATEYDESQVPTEAFKELGRGTLDFKRILELADHQDIKYCMVEQDQSHDPIKSIEVSYNLLSSMD